MELAAVGMRGQGFMLGPGLGKILAETFVSGASIDKPAGTTEYGFVFDEFSLYRGLPEDCPVCPGRSSGMGSVLTFV